MPMTIYKLFSQTAGDSVASLDIQLDGIIKSIHMSASPVGVNTANEGLDAEVSFLSTNSFTANDVRGSLMIIQSESGFVTSGMNQTSVNASISSLEIPVSAGERIHMHVLDQGTLTGRRVHCYLYIEDRGVARVPGRRR